MSQQLISGQRGATNFESDQRRAGTRNVGQEAQRALRGGATTFFEAATPPFARLAIKAISRIYDETEGFLGGEEMLA